MEKSRDALRTISEVADRLGVPTHVLRFWESRFSQVRPIKRAGGRRYYRPSDIALLGGIRQLLHDDGLTIRGVQKILREQGISSVTAMAPPLDHLAGDISGEDGDTTRVRPESEEITSTNASDGVGTAHDRERQMDCDEDPTARSQAARQDRRKNDRSRERPELVERRSAASVAHVTPENGEVCRKAVVGAGTQETGEVEVKDLSAFLKIYDRLLALRDRMDPASERSDEDRTHQTNT